MASVVSRSRLRTASLRVNSASTSPPCTGDYPWVTDPADPSAATGDKLLALFNLADQQTNVRVLVPSGRLAATTGDVVDVSFPSATSAGAECPKILVLPAGNDYRVAERDVSCGLTRELVFDYSDGEGRPVRRSKRTRVILGWHCSAPTSLAQIDCAKGNRVMRVRAIRPVFAAPRPRG